MAASPAKYDTCAQETGGLKLILMISFLIVARLKVEIDKWGICTAFKMFSLQCY